MPSLPSLLTSTTFTDGELTNEIKWYTRVFQVINSIITYCAALPVGLIVFETAIAGATSAGASETLSATTLTCSNLVVGKNYAVRLQGMTATASTSINSVIRVRVDASTVTTSSFLAGSITTPLTSTLSNLPFAASKYFTATSVTMHVGFGVVSSAGVNALFTNVTASVEAV